MKIDLTTWWRDVFAGFGQVVTEKNLLHQMIRFGKRLGFDYVAGGAKGMIVTSQDEVRIVSNYPQAWLDRYMQKNYAAIDPTIRIGARSRSLVIWGDALFRKTPHLWAEAQQFGLKAGLSQPGWARGGIFMMLSLARNGEPVTMAEAAELQPYLLLLTEFFISKMQDLIDKSDATRIRMQLSPREIEVLKWSAAGKTVIELSAILGVTGATVQFHLQNAKRKLGVSTKIQATDHARRLGLIG
ncbi:hypothetical protein WS67_11770 [Burkholderia singularis]|uniref:HTH luxR-type domain-containing protein n=1 Tax=Burkholderia singularis TaxID=1503053 RepID=A0A124P955_9BURK|nr:autoinducer binding domain-containing protein [Burkholderia singularis]KVE27442.1 hypothetical protein WS67_11770 [Burkholderia singularis]